MTDEVQVGVWVLMLYSLSTVAATACIVYLVVNVRKWRKLAIGLSKSLHDCSGVVSAISQRGNLICDTCQRPIAPMTPTLIEESEPGFFTISHSTCQ